MTTSKSTQIQRPLIGIGSCLAGNAVRYNGETNTPNRHVCEICEHFDVQAFCPEMGIGLGVPRPPIHLVGSKESVRVVDVETHRHDYTDAIRSYAQHTLEQAPLLCGYILVKGSPSCGYAGVKRYSQTGDYLASDQSGIFARALEEADSLLPLEDDERLRDANIRESFVNRARAYHHWKTLTGQGLKVRGLINFHASYKPLLIAHPLLNGKFFEPALARAGQQKLKEIAAELINTVMATLSHRSEE